jgi:hypothetical protein
LKARTATSGKRFATAAVAGVSVVALLSGCGFATRQQAAAIVNGEVINEDEVHTTTEQLNKAKLQFSEDIVVTALIAAPLLDEQVQKSGSWKHDDTYAAVVASIPGATETTKEFVAALALLDSGKMTPADVAGYRQALKDADITVNPKYGTLVQGDAPVYFSLGADQPNWIANLKQAAK